jgi:hypothetical protein
MIFTMKRSRVPQRHAAVIVSLSKALGPVPRYQLARVVQASLGVTLKTALDYVLSAVNEGMLQRVGFNVSVRE